MTIVILYDRHAQIQIHLIRDHVLRGGRVRYDTSVATSIIVNGTPLLEARYLQVGGGYLGLLMEEELSCLSTKKTKNRRVRVAY